MTSLYYLSLLIAVITETLGCVYCWLIDLLVCFKLDGRTANRFVRVCAHWSFIVLQRCSRLLLISRMKPWSDGMFVPVDIVLHVVGCKTKTNICDTCLFSIISNQYCLFIIIGIVAVCFLTMFFYWLFCALMFFLFSVTVVSRMLNKIWTACTFLQDCYINILHFDATCILKAMCD